MSECLVSVESVGKAYASVQAVDRLDFRMEQGEVFALLGPNGAGKSTMVRMLVGITRPDTGRIAYPTVPREKLRLGYLPEERGLYPDQPVLRTLEYFGVLNGLDRSQAREAGRSWLARLGLDGRESDQLQTLSKGNQQKVQFISAVLHAPDWIILDEPFSGLDPVNQDFFLELIQELRSGGATILLSAHQMNLVEQIADHILVIDHGRPALQGTMSEIRSRASSREKIICRLDERADPLATVEALSACATLQRAELLPGGELAAWIAPEATLAAALAELGATAPVIAVNSAQVDLHEIFIQTVGRHSGGAA